MAVIDATPTDSSVNPSFPWSDFDCSLILIHWVRAAEGLPVPLRLPTLLPSMADPFETLNLGLERAEERRVALELRFPLVPVDLPLPHATRIKRPV